MNNLTCDISYDSFCAVLKEYFCGLQAKAVNMGTPEMTTGFPSVDNLMGGFEKGKVYVIGGRPCMGKEEFLLSMIIDIVMESKLSALLFATNHLKSDYIQRLLSISCDIPTSHLHRGILLSHEWEKLDKEISALVDVPLYIHDSMELSITELNETVRYCLREQDVKIVFIDCLQMIEFSEKDMTPSEKIAKVMFSLKELAKLLDIPVVVGSVLSREIDHREEIEGKQPQLADLANSSYIEELADVIMMVHRPEYYQILQDDNGRDLHGRIEIIMRKNALKTLGSVYLDYHQETGVVCERKNANNSASKLISLNEFEPHNETVKKLIKAFGLEEDVPF